MNLNLEFSQCPPLSLMMKIWPGLTPGPQPLGIVFSKVSILTKLSISNVIIILDFDKNSVEKFQQLLL